jgi:glycosyltransferase involved in cell wall biosynthesis
MSYNQQNLNNQSSKSEIRHCMVVHNYYPFAETRVQRQAETLINYGCNVDIICLRFADEPEVEKVQGVSVYRLPLRRNKQGGPVMQLFEYLAFLIFAFFKLSALHLKRRYHTVQVHNLPDFLVFAALIPKLTGSRVLLDLHDLMPEFFCAKFDTVMDSMPVRLIRWQEWLSCRFADHVITVTESWRQTLIQRGIAPNKCSVVMNVADSRYFSTNGSNIVNSSSEDDYFRLIYHGTLAHRYGIDLALRALAQVRQEIPNVRLTIHGRGEYLDDIVKIIDELGVQAQVQLSTEFLPTAELPKLIKSNQVGLVPYRRDIFTDGILPTKLMEYTASGLPAIVAHTPGIAAYFDENMVEFFTSEDVDDLARCIRTLYHDRMRLSQLSQNSAKFNQRYNWDSQAAAYYQLIERLAKD